MSPRLYKKILANFQTYLPLRLCIFAKEKYFPLNIPRGWWQDNNVMKKIETTNKERRYVRNKDIP